ncbi:hypothetical protein KAS79_00150 [Candidatus Parcubacteria bacterium]|nr:hypothetical protein [Candidatus Parcubacteria bacterium]
MTENTILKGIGVLAIIILVIGGLWVLKIIFLPVKTVTTQVDSAGKIIDKTYDADNALYNYEWFKTQHEKIVANRQQIENTKTEVKEFKETYGNVTTWGYQTKQEYNRLNRIKLGLINQDKNLVAKYNARSEMANRKIFKDKLPLHVDKMIW